MDIDDDEPPSLVDVNGIGEELAEEPKPIRVPITIVTGEYTAFERTASLIDGVRVPWSREDYST
jgi:hypothetical protein